MPCIEARAFSGSKLRYILSSQLKGRSTVHTLMMVAETFSKVSLDRYIDTMNV
jgi:hypothetical protein